ncbi:hypothetical protein [Streptomyces sp. HPF1205]|uniref:hypothetical protein n=1 Tax=Streptomyces sp. HPF1205 TaxID=2873262 RepID=UPI0027E1686F|nr:hypothetical protein [Streptomyces sp. HPF1205]
MTSRPAADAADAAVWIGTLISQFPELAEELVPGRGSRAAAGPEPGLGRLTDAERERRLARRERRRAEERGEALLLQQRHGLAVPGYSAAPVRLHISDTIRDVTDGVVELEEAVHARLRLGRPRRADVPERLRRLAALLDVIAGHPVLARHVRDETRRMARRVAHALGDTEALVRLPGRCPWCDSVSLRSAPAHGTVLCVNPACRCDDPDCGCHDDPAYRHVWPSGTGDAPGASGAGSAADTAGPAGPAGPAGTADTANGGPARASTTNDPRDPHRAGATGGSPGPRAARATAAASGTSAASSTSRTSGTSATHRTYGTRAGTTEGGVR